MSYIEEYKRGLALLLGTLCLIIALFLPAKFALGLTDKTDVWTNLNWIFLALGIIFMWAEIAVIAKAVQNGASNFISKKTK